MEREVGRKVANALSENLVTELSKYEILCKRATAPPSPQDNVLLLQGRFMSVDEGNATQRMVIGFGMGRSVVQAHGLVYQLIPQGQKLLGQFETEVKSGGKPGIGPMVGLGGSGRHCSHSSRYERGAWCDI